MTPEQILCKEIKLFSNDCGIAITSITTLPIEDALIKAMHEYGRQSFEASRKIGNPQDGSVAFWTYEEYINSEDYHQNKTH